jgi:hypothetical protein
MPRVNFWYNWVRIHKMLGVTPTMAAGWTDRLFVYERPRGNGGRRASQTGQARAVQEAGRMGELVQRFPNPDGKRWVELRKRPDGLFYFLEFYEAKDDVPGYGIETYTAMGWQSGLYKDQEEAERDLRKMTPWLRENSN